MTKQMDMTQGKLVPKIIEFALPLIATNIIQQLFNVADQFVVGNFAGEAALAAVGSNGAIINAFINLFIGISIAVGIIAAQAIGAKDAKKQERLSSTAFYSSIVMGIGIAIIGFIFSRYIIKLMKSPPDVIDGATLYLKIYFWGCPFVLLYNYFASIIRAMGDTKSPFIYLVISGVVNIILNLVFVICFKIYIPGVAIATIISQAVSAVLVVRHMMRLTGPLKFVPKNVYVDKKIFAEMLKLGIPSGLQGMTFSLSNMLIQSSVNSLGTDAVAGNAAEGNVECIVYLALNAIANSAMNFIGQNYGAKKYKRIPKVMLYCLALQFVISSVCASIMLPFRNTLIGLFVPGEPRAIAFGASKLVIILSTYFLCGFMDTAAYTLRGMGITLSPFLIFTISVCGLRVLWIFTVFSKLHTIEALFAVYPVSWIIPFLILLCEFIFVYKKRLCKAI